MLNLVVLVSGSGSNLQAIIDCIDNGQLNARIRGVLSNRADAYALTRAQQNIPTAVISHTAFPDRLLFDRAMMQQIDQWSPDIVVLAGFMRILTSDFVTHYQDRLLNIHPSLLPKYKGMHTHQRALKAGDTTHGCSVHFVTAELDGGPVIAQAVVPIFSSDDESTLTERVHKGEHRLYPQVLMWIADGQLSTKNGQIRFKEEELTEPLRIDLS